MPARCRATSATQVQRGGLRSEARAAVLGPAATATTFGGPIKKDRISFLRELRVRARAADVHVPTARIRGSTSTYQRPHRRDEAAFGSTPVLAANPLLDSRLQVLTSASGSRAAPMSRRGPRWDVTAIPRSVRPGGWIHEADAGPNPARRRAARELGKKFQVRLYRFGKDAERIPKTQALAGKSPASRSATASSACWRTPSLPLGAIVLLSDGADNAGGIDLANIAAIRRQRIPVHTIGFGKESPDKDIEIADVSSRTVARSGRFPIDVRTVTLRQYRASRAEGQSVRCAKAARCWLSQDVTLKSDGQLQTRDPGVQRRRRGAPKPCKFPWTRSPAKRTARTTASPGWSTWNRASRASSISKASRVGVQVHPPRDRGRPRAIELVDACCAPRRTRSTARASRIRRSWRTASRPSRKSCSPSRG